MRLARISPGGSLPRARDRTPRDAKLVLGGARGELLDRVPVPVPASRSPCGCKRAPGSCRSASSTRLTRSTNGPQSSVPQRRSADTAFATETCKAA